MCHVISSAGYASKLKQRWKMVGYYVDVAESEGVDIDKKGNLIESDGGREILSGGEGVHGQRFE